MRLSSVPRKVPSSCGITHHFWWLSPAPGQIAHVFLTRPPRDRPRAAPFDLHALGTPPALILSQDQTLHQNKLPQAAPLARRSLRACVPLLVSHPVAPAPRLATTPGTPVVALTFCVFTLRHPTRLASRSRCRCFLCSAPRARPRQGHPHRSGPCSTLTCQGALVNLADSAIFTRRLAAPAIFTALSRCCQPRARRCPSHSDSSVFSGPLQRRGRI